jgi:hypothetical protein
MLDLERCISEDGISDGYTFFQDESTITLTFPVPISTSPTEIDFDIFDDDRAIFTCLRGSEPVICGTMFESVFQTDFSVQSTLCSITLQKVNRCVWPVFIIGAARDFIDVKSLFMLGVYDDASARPRSAWQHFLDSADRGYLPAKLLIASTLLNDGNPFSVATDESEAVRVLLSVPRALLPREAALALFQSLEKVGRVSEAHAVIAEAARASNEAKWEFVQFLERQPDAGDPAVRVRTLEELAAANHALACRDLARAYAQGEGVRRNPDRAQQLAQKAHALDPALPAEIPDDGAGWNFALTAVATLGFLGVALGAWRFVARNRQAPVRRPTWDPFA